MLKLPKLNNLSINGLYAKLVGVDSKRYWDFRFKRNWELNNGRLQTAIFAMGFALLDVKFKIDTILDYGCGCGDSIPVLKMKYPETHIFFYDFSMKAMEKANQNYACFAQPFDVNTGKTFDLVYCSNVIEHVPDPISFCKKLISLSHNYVVIQAPYNEVHADGSSLTFDRKLDEHVNTINERLIESLHDGMHWDIKYSDIPYAWPRGKQIFFLGTLKND